MRNLARDTEQYIVNTHWHTRPTYVSATGYKRNIDFFSMSKRCAGNVTKCCALGKLGRKLQLADTAEVVDHVPLPVQFTCNCIHHVDPPANLNVTMQGQDDEVPVNRTG